MELTTTFSLNSVGDKTQNPYTGTFKVKTILTRREQFVADQYRRDIIGSNPESAMPTLVGEAFMIGQLRVRVVDAPKWFTDANYGLELLDGNLIPEIFELTMKAANAKEEEMNKAANAAKVDLTKVG